MKSDPRKVLAAKMALSDPRRRQGMSQEQIAEAEEINSSQERYADNLEKTARGITEYGEFGNSVVDNVLEVLGMITPAADFILGGKKAVEGDYKDAAINTAAAFTPIPSGFLKTGFSDALSKISRRFGVDDSARRSAVNFAQEEGERKLAEETMGSFKSGGRITGPSPLLILAQKMFEMMKGEEEKPIIIRQNPNPTPRTQSPYIPTAEEARNYNPADSSRSNKQTDVLTNLIAARLLQGKR